MSLWCGFTAVKTNRVLGYVGRKERREQQTEGSCSHPDLELVKLLLGQLCVILVSPNTEGMLRNWKWGPVGGY